MQNVPRYPGAQPPVQNPFVELHGSLFKQWPLHGLLQSATFSQPLIYIFVNEAESKKTLECAFLSLILRGKKDCPEHIKLQKIH